MTSFYLNQRLPIQPHSEALEVRIPILEFWGGHISAHNIGTDTDNELKELKGKSFRKDGGRLLACFLSDPQGGSLMLLLRLASSECSQRAGEGQGKAEARGMALPSSSAGVSGSSSCFSVTLSPSGQMLGSSCCQVTLVLG